MTNELRLSVGDLRFLTAECAQCQTSVTFDLAVKDPPTSSACPLCYRERQTEFPFVSLMHKAYRELSGSSLYSFRVALPLAQDTLRAGDPRAPDV
jgi:hypothetical protein